MPPYGFQNQAAKLSKTSKIEEENPLNDFQKSQQEKEIFNKIQDISVDSNKKVHKKLQKQLNEKTQQIDLDQEFLPNVPEVKKKRRTPQNANRNIVPNIMNQVVSFMFKKSRSGHLVQKLLEQMAVKGSSIKRFYTYQSLIKEKLNHYVNGQSLLILNQLQQPACEIYSEEEQRLYTKICRLLVQYFLSHDFDQMILTSKRMKSDKRLENLKIKRMLLEKFSEILHL